MPVDIAPQHTKANPITKGLAVELAGPIFEPHETVEYRTSSHKVRCKGSPPIVAEPNLSTSMNSWKDRHT